MFALLAGVERKTTLWALPHRISEILQQRAALRTTGNGSGSGHVQWTRPEGIVFFGTAWFGSGWLFELFFWPTTGILVTALPILAVGQRAPPAKRLIVRFCRGPHKRFFRDVLAYTGQPACGRPPLIWATSPGAMNCVSHIAVLPSDVEEKTRR